jgi:hypothetical protein
VYILKIVFCCFQHPVVGRVGSGTKPKGTRLERAIRDLQKIVAECQYHIVFSPVLVVQDVVVQDQIQILETLLADRPPTIDINEVDPNGQAGVKRRLPQEVKQKLAKVARLSVCCTTNNFTLESSAFLSSMFLVHIFLLDLDAFFHVKGCIPYLLVERHKENLGQLDWARH